MKVFFLFMFFSLASSFSMRASFVQRRCRNMAAFASTIGAVGSTLTNSDLALEALAKFLRPSEIEEAEIVPTQGGVNNIVQYVSYKTPSGEKKRVILRIYNNGLNSARVRFEHEILKQLNTVQLSFSVPSMLSSLVDKDVTNVKLSNGAEACMVEIIPGGLPKLTCVEDIGRASGELNTAIGKVKISESLCTTPPYYDIFAVHHAVTRELFLREIKSSAFDSTREYATKMTQEIMEIEEKCKQFHKLGLPKALIHGDLHYDNVLVENGKVTGLLDFEFAAFDWRAMELAICLSKYAGEEQAMDYFDKFISGYVQKGVLTPQEIEVIPDLINLRILSNVVYFVGRHLGGEDDISSLTKRIANYCARVEWVKANAQNIRNSIQTKFAQVNK